MTDIIHSFNGNEAPKTGKPIYIYVRIEIGNRLQRLYLDYTTFTGSGRKLVMLTWTWTHEITANRTLLVRSFIDRPLQFNRSFATEQASICHLPPTILLSLPVILHAKLLHITKNV